MSFYCFEPNAVLGTVLCVLSSGTAGFARDVCLTDRDAEAPGREGLRAYMAEKSLRSALLTGKGEFMVAGSGSAARSSAGCWAATLPSAHETRDAGGTSQA